MKRCKTCSHYAVCDKAKHIENYRIEDCEHYSGWISVEERLPEKGGMYLTYNPNRAVSQAVTARYSAEKCRWVSAEACCYHEGITHWQPLPEPPKEGV